MPDTVDGHGETGLVEVEKIQVALHFRRALGELHSFVTKRKPTKKISAQKTPASKKPLSRRGPKWIGTVDDVARELNLRRRRIYQLVQEGLPQVSRGRYDIGKCLQFYVRFLQRKIVQRALPEDGERDETTTSAGATKHKLLSIEVELKQLELADRREQLVSSDKVQKDFAALATEIKTRILALPPRLAAEVLGETDLAIAQSKIDRSLKTTLESLSRFDPDGAAPVRTPSA
jgi:hypothetical protein